MKQANQAYQSNTENLYEIPNCTICLNQLCQDLSNLNCGHVFHLNCISQHFQYRGTCPNCQKRSHAKQIRMVVFPLQKNTQAAQMMRQILGNLSVQQKQQIQTLFKQYQASVEKCQKLQKSHTQTQKQNKKLESQLNQTKTSYNRTKLQTQTLRKDVLDCKKAIESLHVQIKSLTSENLQLRVQIENYKEKEGEYDKMRKLKKYMNQNSADLIKLKNQLQQTTRPQQRAKQFFDMLMMKNLDIVKLKSRLQEIPQKIQEKQDEIRKLKHSLQREKKQSKDINERHNMIRKKYQDLKVQYRKLLQKYRAKCNGNLSEEQNYQDSISRPNFPIVQLNRQASKDNANSLSFMFQKKGQNISVNANISFNNKQTKKNQSKINSSQSAFDSMMIQEEDSINVARNVNKSRILSDFQTQKKSNQNGSLNSFVTQKSNFGSFGGVAVKKKAEDKKVGMKNLFG